MNMRRCLWAIALAFGLVPSARAEEPGLDIYFIDVQGGAATLIVTPERESILLDTGWPGFDDRDPKRIAHVIKDVARLDHLDHLVTTHWHVDHFGGVEGLSKLVDIRQFWDRGLPEDKLPGLDFPDGPKADDPLGIAYRKASAGKRKPLLPGDRLPLKSVEALVLASGGKVITPEQRYGSQTPVAAENAACTDAPADKPIDPSDNARSLAILFRSGAFTFFDGGDLTWNVEKQLVCPVNLVGWVEAYQVTHHGMDISNHPTLVKTVAPQVAIMNNGPRKGGAPGAVKLLQGQPNVKALFALHKNQDTPADANADPELTANADPEGGQFIHLHYDPSTRKYTVQIGTDGAKREFETRFH